MAEALQYGQQCTTTQYVTWDDNAEQHKCQFCCCRCCHIWIGCAAIAILQMLGSAITVIGAIVHLVRFGSYLLEGAIIYTVVFQMFAPILLILTAILVLVAIQKTNPSLVTPHIAVMIIGMVLVSVIGILVVVVVIAISASSIAMENQIEKVFGRRTETMAYGAIIGISVFFLLMVVAALMLQAYFIRLFKQLRDYLKDKRAAIGGTAQMIRY